MGKHADRLAAIDHRILLLQIERDGAWGIPAASLERRAAIQQQLAQERDARKGARMQKEYERMTTEAKQKAEQIRKRAIARLREVAERLRQFPPLDADQTYGVRAEEYNKKRSNLLHEWRMTEEQAFAAMEEWVEANWALAQALYDSDPVGDAATESRRVADELAITGLAAPLIGQPQAMIRNRLLSEARRLIASNAPDRARVYVEAARRAGVTDGRLDNALTEALDRSVPHRRQAREQMDEIVLQRDLLRNDIYSERLTQKVGTTAEQAATSANLKMRNFMQEQRAAAQQGGAE
ncbi:MAG TPA: hypothetical protein VGQ58_07160 [Candidatus Limnocylindrales bacterium]|jgi:hypothetical protein|nr:hypothetical protein [Candidatus Limnocylindrales bacterium]